MILDGLPGARIGGKLTVAHSTMLPRKYSKARSMIGASISGA